ncbi:MAG: hypothetical protein GY713_12685, partial [Actinomycetia bacterium]|nr:hypothetical protein [Actinomycetes bacterium]
MFVSGLRASLRVWTLAILFFAGVAGGEGVGEGPVNLLLITVDTLRPDALGWVVEGNDTPAIDALAAEGFR